MSKKTRRSKPYTIRISDKKPYELCAADWHRFMKLGLIEPVINDDHSSLRVATLCRGVVAWLDAGRIVLQNTMIRVFAYVRTSSNWPCPFAVSEETIYYWHCLTDRGREAWDAQRLAVK